MENEFDRVQRDKETGGFGKKKKRDWKVVKKRDRENHEFEIKDNRKQRQFNFYDRNRMYQFINNFRNTTL